MDIIEKIHFSDFIRIMCRPYLCTKIFDDENNNWFYASLSDGFSIRSECK